MVNLHVHSSIYSSQIAANMWLVLTERQHLKRHETDYPGKIILCVRILIHVCISHLKT